MGLKAGINKLSTTRKKDGEHVTVGLAITLELQAPDADERGDISEAIDTGQKLYVNDILCTATGLRMRKTKEDSVTQVVLEADPLKAEVARLYELCADGLLVTISEAQGRLPMDSKPEKSFHDEVKGFLDDHGVEYQENVTVINGKVVDQNGEILDAMMNAPECPECASIGVANCSAHAIETPVNNTEPIETETPSELQIGPDWLQPGKPVRIKANGDFKGLTGTVVDVWDEETIQVRGDDGVLIGATFGERHLEAVE